MEDGMEIPQKSENIYQMSQASHPHKEIIIRELPVPSCLQQLNSVIAKMWKQPRWLPPEDRVEAMWYVWAWCSGSISYSSVAS